MELERVDVTKGVFPIHDDVYSVQIMAECMSIRRYYAEGLYTTIGLNWLLPSTAILKSVIVGKRLELFPLSVKLLLLLPTPFGSDVCVD